ncbi:MAG: PEP-CTERM sorting domain-containing protein [Burkholderiaceae bacterium]|nr:PEP-CTERM sorting domain-containing protein [Burkholderiaceae bacterium]
MYKKALAALALIGAAASAQASILLLNENFDDVNALPGWVLTNQSTPGGLTGWFQGNDGVFTAQSGADNAYIAANFNNAGRDVNGVSTLNNWLITPTFSTELAGQISFWARHDVDVSFDDFFTFGLSSGSASPASFSVGSLVQANTDWTLYTLNFAANGAGSVGRFAINYLGDADTSNYIGFDTLTITSVPEPSSWMLMAIGALGLLSLRRRQKN